MPEKIPLYTQSRETAQKQGGISLWQQSHAENIRCAQAIRNAIDKHYDGYRLDPAAAQPVIEEFGYDRIFWVIANTIQIKDGDGRFSYDNRGWADRIHIPHDRQNIDFLIDGRSGLLDLFLNEAKEQYHKSLGMFGRSQCESGAQDYAHRVLVVKPDWLSEPYKKPEHQLFYATGGFGCHPDSLGWKVMGRFLFDGEQATLSRADFLGVLKDEFLPEWAEEKLKELQPQDEQQDGPTM